jgi:hypothetical protein
MAQFFLRFSRFLMVSRRHKRVRGSVIFLFRNFLLVVAALLTAEVVLICMGIFGMYLPLPGQVWEVLLRAAFWPVHG